MANPMGFLILTRYYEGDATVLHLDQALLRKWINQAEYDLAVAGLPPEGYVPTPTLMSMSSDVEAPAES